MHESASFILVQDLRVGSHDFPSTSGNGNSIKTNVSSPVPGTEDVTSCCVIYCHIEHLGIMSLYSEQNGAQGFESAEIYCKFCLFCLAALGG